MAKIKKDAFGNIIPNSNLIPDTIPKPITPQTITPAVLPQNQTATQTNTTIPTPLTPDQNAQINQDISKTMSTLPPNPTIDEVTLAGRLALSGVAPKQGSMGMPSSLSQQVKEIYATQTNPQLIENMLRNVLTREQQGLDQQTKDEESRFIELAKTPDGRKILMQEAQSQTGFFQYLFDPNNPQQTMIKKLSATPLTEAPPDTWSSENLKTALGSLGASYLPVYSGEITNAMQLLRQSFKGAITKQEIGSTASRSSNLAKGVGKGLLIFGVGRYSNMPQKLLSDSDSVITASEQQSNDIIDLVKSGEYTGTEGLIQLNQIKGTINDTEKTIAGTNKASLMFYLNGGKDTQFKILNARNNIDIQRRLLLNMIASGEIRG